ncbi:hypothetical protein TWF694_006685 [Orbilia ellipsospora]|uniref:F-box domain-containing protein n=1 Tax=Orbilia ellipsospora TaxID=2528407 RepID=A0AAV9XNF9_9PEZI
MDSQLARLGDANPMDPKNITNLPLDILEDIASLLKEDNLLSILNLAATCRHLRFCIGPSNHLFWHKVLGKVDFGQSVWLRTFESDLDYFALTKRAYIRSQTRCYWCHKGRKKLEMMIIGSTSSHWQRHTDHYFLGCQPCADKNTVELESLQGTPVYSYCIVLNTRIFRPPRNQNTDPSRPNQQEGARKCIDRKILEFIAPYEEKYTPEGREEIAEKVFPYVEKFRASCFAWQDEYDFAVPVTKVYAQQYTLFHILLPPEHFFAIWRTCEQIMKKTKCRTPKEIRRTVYPGDLTGVLLRMLYENETIRPGRWSNRYLGLDSWSGQAVQDEFIRECEEFMIFLFGFGDGFPFFLKEVEKPKFLLHILDYWHNRLFCTRLWLPDEKLSRCPICLVYCSTLEVYKDTPGVVSGNILEHIVQNHSDMGPYGLGESGINWKPRLKPKYS